MYEYKSMMTIIREWWDGVHRGGGAAFEARDARAEVHITGRGNMIYIHNCIS